VSAAGDGFPGAREFPEGTRTAADAAAAIGCDVGQIVKSLVFVRGGRSLPVPVAGGDVVLVLCSGANTVDAERLGLQKADATFAREHSGFAIGGVPPYGWRGATAAPETLVDEDLLGYDEVWAAAGTPRSVFPLTPAELVRRSGGVATKVSPAS
jgi:prolyl-tRNA editing enzyme YbaK/EbsC (Cys-tRNA(Pro) deacylase)